MGRRTPVLIVCTLVALSSGEARAVGEQHNGFPSPWERALFMAANRARSNPATVKGASSAVLPPQAPLTMVDGLLHSSRFHAVSLEKGLAPLQHTSPCTLNSSVGTSGCGGAPACACVGGQSCMSCTSCSGGTDPFTRIGYFYGWGGSAGEVANAGVTDPWSSMEVWVDEPAGNDGHRQIIDAAGSHVAGFGHAEGTPGACWKQFDVGDLAGNAATPAPIPSAAPKPIAGPAGSFRVYATWNDPSGGAPRGLSTVVDGNCASMTHEIGDPKLNATYYADLTLAAGCHSVYILARDASGMLVSYPSTTAFTIPVDGQPCAEETTQPPPNCDPTSPLPGPHDHTGGCVFTGSSSASASAPVLLIFLLACLLRKCQH